jgi:hypothetical protein
MNASKMHIMSQHLRQNYMDGSTREIYSHQSRYTEKVSQHELNNNIRHQP